MSKATVKPGDEYEIEDVECDDAREALELIASHLENPHDAPSLDAFLSVCRADAAVLREIAEEIECIDDDDEDQPPQDWSGAWPPPTVN